MHVQVSCRKNYTKTSGVPGDVSRNNGPNFVVWNINGIDHLKGVSSQQRNKFSVWVFASAFQCTFDDSQPSVENDWSWKILCHK